MQGVNLATQATNTMSVYQGDPDNGGTLLTNIQKTVNYLNTVTGSFLATSKGTITTNYFSPTQPVVGGYVTLTTIFNVINASASAGNYLFYPAVSNS